MHFKHKLSHRFALMRGSLSVVAAATAILSCNRVNGPAEPVAGTVLVSEGFENGNLDSRGWFDATTVVTATDARPGSSGTHALQWHWTVGSTAPQGTSRITFTPSSAVYVSYWVKMSSNWVGSGQPHHPHMSGFLTTEDDPWIGPSRTHLTTYDEIAGCPQYRSEQPVR
jgi:hypothetical protein